MIKQKTDDKDLKIRKLLRKGVRLVRHDPINTTNEKYLEFRFDIDRWIKEVEKEIGE